MEEKRIVISYIPKLYSSIDEAFIELDNKEAVQKLNKVMGDPDNHVKAIVWAMTGDQKQIYPVILMEDAFNVARHIEQWTEGDVAGWFEVQIREQDGRYAVVLYPNVKRSVERQAKFYEIHFGKKIDKKVEVEVIFMPLSFISESSHTYNKVKGQLGETTMIGFTTDLETEPYILGNGKRLKLNKQATGYIESAFEE